MIDELGRQLLGWLAVLALALGPAFTAAWFLLRRKRLVRKARRSPLTTDLLRPPGHALRERLEDLRLDLAFDLGILMFVPVFPLAYFQMHSMLLGKTIGGAGMVLALLLVAAFVAYQVRKMLRNAADMDKLRLGLDAELAVGQELDQLMRDGAVVFHDMPAERFNIDHVVIAREGVFAVETKGYSKPIRNGGVADATAVFDGKTLSLPDRSGTKAIEQAQRQARWLADWLKRSTGEPVHVTPVLALPGWWVERKGRSEVLVFSGKELRKHLLKARAAALLSNEQVQRVVHQVEQRCRTVAPEFAPSDEKAT